MALSPIWASKLTLNDNTIFIDFVDFGYLIYIAPNVNLFGPLTYTPKITYSSSFQTIFTAPPVVHSSFWGDIFGFLQIALFITFTILLPEGEPFIDDFIDEIDPPPDLFNFAGDIDEFDAVPPAVLQPNVACPVTADLNVVADTGPSSGALLLVNNSTGDALAMAGACVVTSSNGTFLVPLLSVQSGAILAPVSAGVTFTLSGCCLPAVIPP